jgi:hypothetical protein
MAVLLACQIFIAVRLPAYEAAKIGIDGIVTLAAGFYVENMDATPSIIDRPASYNCRATRVTLLRRTPNICDKNSCVSGKVSLCNK